MCRNVEQLTKNLEDAPKTEYLPGKTSDVIVKGRPDPSDATKIIRDNPDTYLDSVFIKAYLKQTDDGVVKITIYSPNKEFNGGLLGSVRDGSQEFTTFVMPKSLVKDMIEASNGNTDILEDLLGFSRGDSKDGFHVLEIDKPTNIRVPSGNEGGAFEDFWKPGGKTHPGGIPEAVIDAPSWNDYHEISIDELLRGK